MARRTAAVLALLLVCACSPASAAADASSYVELDGDVTVSSPRDVLETTISLPAAETVLVASDGRFGPAGGGAARVYVTVDGQRVSNESGFSWRGSRSPQQHSLNAIGVVRLAAGTHRVALRALRPDGSYYVGGGTNLSAFVRPAAGATASETAAPSRVFDFTTRGVVTADNGTVNGTPTPHEPLLSHYLGAGQGVVSFGSGTFGRAFPDRAPGDAMMGIYADGAHPGNLNGSWSVNDLYEGAEGTAPMAVQAYLPPGAQGRRVSLDATEFPFRPGQQGGENGVNYRAEATTKLVSLWGAELAGAAAPSKPPFQNNWYDYTGVGADRPYGDVPAIGTKVAIASTTITVPEGRDATVFFAAKTRVQGDEADAGGTARLRLAIDGREVGSTGIQQLGGGGNAVSQRTITASYLATGSGALSPGTHQVQVLGQAQGSFAHLAMTHDAPLVYVGRLSPPSVPARGPAAARLVPSLAGNKRRVRVSRRRRLVVGVHCRRAGTGTVPARCGGTLALTKTRRLRSGRRRTRYLALRRFSIPVGRRTRVHIKVGRATGRLLRAGTLSGRWRVTVRNPGTASGRTSRAVRVAGPRR